MSGFDFIIVCLFPEEYLISSILLKKGERAAALSLASKMVESLKFLPVQVPSTI